MAAVSVTTSATQIVPARTAYPSRAGLIVGNNSAVTVFLGLGASAGSVTAATGIPLPAGQSLTFSGLSYADGAVYGIVATGTADIRYIEL